MYQASGYYAFACVLSCVQLFGTPWTEHARILEWVSISSCRGSSWPRDQTQVSCVGRWVLHHWATCRALVNHGSFSKRLAWIYQQRNTPTSKNDSYTPQCGNHTKVQMSIKLCLSNLWPLRITLDPNVLWSHTSVVLSSFTCCIHQDRLGYAVARLSLDSKSLKPQWFISYPWMWPTWVNQGFCSSPPSA